MALVAMGTGCYRASGVQHPVMVAEQVLPNSIEHTGGLKADAIPGDYCLSSDRLQLVVDGSKPTANNSEPSNSVSGALGGGSIIDACQVALDGNYKRSMLPADALERITPVLNQNPELPLVMSTYRTVSTEETASIEMTGHVKGALPNAEQLQVAHRISLGREDRFFTLTTTVTNRGQQSVAVNNIGDMVCQRSPLLRFNVPAASPVRGYRRNPLSTGVQLQNSLAQNALSVEAPMIAMMGAEPSGTIEDIHTSYGILPVSCKKVLVNSDQQDALNALKPEGAKRLIAGSPWQQAGLAPNQSMTYTRRLYVVSGPSSANNHPSQATGVFNRMAMERTLIDPSQTLGRFIFEPSGTIARMGSTPTQFCLQRQLQGSTWVTERTEWFEPFDTAESLDKMDKAEVANPHQLSVMVPAGTYRLLIQTSHEKDLAIDTLTNTNTKAPFKGPTSIQIPPYDYAGEAGHPISNAFKAGKLQEGALEKAKNAKGKGHFFSNQSTTPQPMRVVVIPKNAQKDLPACKRVRTLGSLYNYDTKQPVGKNSTAAFGIFGFQAGNGFFGASCPKKSPACLWLPTPSTQESYRAFAYQGPLSFAKELNLGAENSHVFSPFQSAPLPPGWTSLDIPGPSLATTGGMLPVEKLSSALAEGVQVVGMTETDRYSDYRPLMAHFENELAQSGANTKQDAAGVGPVPIIFNACTNASGQATACFVPSANPNQRNGGAPQTNDIKEFIHKTGDAFTLFHCLNADSANFAIPAHVNAIELIRAEGFTDKQFTTMRQKWFDLLTKQTPSAFTKALGLSSGKFSLDTPVGLARTYVKAEGFSHHNVDPLRQALHKGALVASTGPLLNVTLKQTTQQGAQQASLGEHMSVSSDQVELHLALLAPPWVPVEAIHVFVNGEEKKLLPMPRAEQDISELTEIEPAKVPSELVWSKSDSRLRTGTFLLDLRQVNANTTAFVVVQAGVPEGVKAADTAKFMEWNALMKGMPSLAVTNPIWITKVNREE